MKGVKAVKKNFITDKNEKITYSVKKSKRKTISIAVLQDGEVVVHAPNFVSEATIGDILSKKQSWIVEKRNKIVKQMETMDRFNYLSYEDGSNLLYQGTLYPLFIIEDTKYKKPKVVFDNEQFYIYGNNSSYSEKREALRLWYREQARGKIIERISYYDKIIGVNYGTIRIKEQKGCYGSCSSKGNLNFNLKCILAPPEILDYVVVHELCHLKYFNHSEQFWSLVSSVLPDYKQRRAWLKEMGTLLNY